MLDQVTRDTAYDNGLAVAESARWIQTRNNESAIYRGTHTGHLDIPYAAAERTAFDLYPAADVHAPCMVFIHGGYWQRNSREMFACMAEGAASLGWSVAIPGYSLAPQSTLRGIVSEIGQALDWLLENGLRFGIGGPVLLAGWSAGAHLAAMHLDHPAVAAGLAISGVYELAPIRDTNLDKALRLTDDEIRDLSPLHRPVIHKPMTIAYGSLELPALVHDAWNLYGARSTAGADGLLVPVAGADHFSILPELQHPDGVLMRAAAELLAPFRSNRR